MPCNDAVIFNLHVYIRKLLSIFGDLLKNFRKLQHQTQTEFIEEIAAFSNEFSALNTVTLSRWENDTTGTSLHRKRLILKYFHSKGLLKQAAYIELIENRFKQLVEPLSATFEHNYASIIHNLPQLRIASDAYEVHTLSEINDTLRYQHIINIEEASHADGFYQTSISQLQELVSHPNSFTMVIEKNGQHLGHFIMYKVKSETTEKLVHNRLKERDLSKKDLCDVGEDGDYYIHALYGVNQTIAAMLNTETYIHLLHHIDTINNIVIFSSRKDGVRLAKAYGIQVVDKGEDTTYNLTWHGMCSPVEDILFSDTVLKLVF
jgi:transcriptional regulator with XRE-family HTH domain